VEPHHTGYRLQERFLSPCDLPACFSREIRRIVESYSVIHCDDDAGGYSPEELMRTRRPWDLQRFARNWTGYDGEEPPQGEV
jgi:hypothetical protein